MSQNKKPLLIIVALAVLSLTSALFYAKFFQSPAIKDDQYAVEQLGQGILSVQNGDFDAAILYGEEVLSSADVLGAGVITAAKFNLAPALWWRNASGDRIRAVTLYKDLVQNSELPNPKRARAAVYMLTLLQVQQDDQFDKNYVFNDGIFKPFLSDAGGRIDVARFHFIKWANSLDPSPFVKPAVAYAISEILINNPLLSDATRSKYLKELDSILAELNAIKFDLFVVPDKDEYLPFADAVMKKGLANFERAALNADGADLFGVAEKDFKLALSFVDKAEAEKATLGMYGESTRLFIKISYAALLRVAYGDARGKDIDQFLNEIASSSKNYKTSLFMESLKKLSTYRSANPNFFAYKNVVALAAFNGNFSAFLKSNGWQ